MKYFPWTRREKPGYSFLAKTEEVTFPQEEDEQLHSGQSMAGAKSCLFVLILINSIIFIILMQICSARYWRSSQGIETSHSIHKGLRFLTADVILLTLLLVPEEVRKLNWDEPVYGGWPSKETNDAWHELAGRKFKH